MNSVQPRYTIVRRGKLVTFYKNGDPYYKGLRTSVSGKHFVTLSTLLSWLNDKIPLTTGVKHVLRLPDGVEVTDVTQFQAGKSYVVSSVKKLNTKIQYEDGAKKIHPINDFDDFFGDSNLAESFPPDEKVKLPLSNTQQHHSSVPDFHNPQDYQHRQQKDSVLAALNSQYTSFNKKDFTSNRVDDTDHKIIMPDIKNKSNVGSNSVFENFNKERRESMKKIDADTNTDPFDEPINANKQYISARVSSAERTTPKDDISDVRLRSKTNSIQSSAGSSGSGSDKLSGIDQPRNKTFFPLDHSDQCRLPRRHNKVVGSQDTHMFPQIHRSSLPRYDEEDEFTESKTSSNYGTYKISNQRKYNLNLASRDSPSDEFDNFFNPPPRSTGELRKNPSASKIWTPLSFQEKFRKKVKPRIIQIISNTNRKSQQRVIFNPKTLQSFEEVLKDLEKMVIVQYPPVSAIFTAEEPFVKVLSLSHLSGELQHCEDFLVCGREEVPLEIHPNFSKSYDSDLGSRRSRVVPNLKTSRSEERLDFTNASPFEGSRKYPPKSRRSKMSDDLRSGQTQPVNLFVNSKPTDPNLQISVGCQSKNCGCQLHATLSKYFGE